MDIAPDMVDIVAVIGAVADVALPEIYTIYTHALRLNTPTGVACRKRRYKEQCQVHAGEENHARPEWTTSRRGQDSPWKYESE